ncbi:P2X purinoceptor 4 isoform X2 [Carassius gibelio]|uniref:P2X purinoceptor 4 isoform X2 n=1 Tax=Carassius gibelio TaxID=101364 RepID=UPI0022791678|nr:P2X purinoceptor 4 isoform X2 [Carassius gibelio]
MNALEAVAMKMIEKTKNFFSEYTTPQKLVVKSSKIGVLYRLYQLTAIPYALWYVALIGGHQETDTILSSVTTKVKGIALTNTTELGEQIWDVADYIIPAQYPTPKSICTSDMNCTKGFKDLQGNGVQTGRCVHYSKSVKTCEVLGWCPVEKKVEPPNPALLADAENFTVFIKNNIQFTKFNFSKTNILPKMTRSYLANCALKRNMDPDCPIFRIKYIFEEAREDFQTMAVYGGVMAVQIQWECNLDLNLCAPQYSFRRLDKKGPNSSEPSVHNLRFAKYYKNSNDKDTRTLIKGYGIRFDVLVYGEAKKFDFLKTILHMGALVSLLRLVDCLFDLLAWLLVKGYKENKFKYLHVYGPTSNAAPTEMKDSHFTSPITTYRSIS